MVFLIARRYKLSRPIKDRKASATFNSVKPEMTHDKSSLEVDGLLDLSVSLDVLYMCFSVNLVMYVCMVYFLISLGLFLIFLDPYECVSRFQSNHLSLSPPMAYLKCLAIRGRARGPEEQKETA